VVDDNLVSGANGWNVYSPLAGQTIGWNNPSSAGAAPIDGVTSNFAGVYLYPTDNNQVLKKQYDLSQFGSFTYIKVKFKFYFIDSWGFNGNDRGWAAFADGANGSQMRVGWQVMPQWLNNNDTDFNTIEFHQANNFEGNGMSEWTDYMENGEMTTFKNGSSNSFWLYFGVSSDEATDNERYGVGMIEIWVK
jgi:hypothetical protein